MKCSACPSQSNYIYETVSLQHRMLVTVGATCDKCGRGWACHWIDVDATGKTFARCPKPDELFADSEPTTQPLPTIPEYGVLCGKCGVWCPDAERIDGFKCFSCRRGGV